MRKTIISVMALVAAMTAGAEEKRVTSPDGGLVVTVSDEGGKPVYSVSLDGNECITKSPLGVVLNFADYSTGMKMAGQAEQKTVDVDYRLRNIKRSHVNHKATVMTLPFEKEGKKAFDLVMHVSDNDVAFRYLILPDNETQVAVVKEEKTGFSFPEGSTTFLCPQSAPMNGFARTSPSYETNYTLDDAMGKNGWGNGYSFPCLFKINNEELGIKNWVLISETGVDGSYCAGRLLNKEGGCYVMGQPQPGEMNGAGSTSPAISLPGYTPWRTITLGESLAPIVETTIPFDVVKPKYEAKQEAKYGRGSWSWIIGMDPSCNFDEQKRYIDFSAAMGYESVLVDALWDTQIGREKIAELARYGKSKGVALYLWYNSNGAWNDAPQGPRHLMDKSHVRRQEMAWMKSIGIRGIKVDFFGGDKQPMMQLYEDILSDANDYGLLVIFHGCTLPRGWERMYPAFAASEAVLASENLHFSQGMCDAEAKNASIHPFIRNTVGSMDFGGSTLNKFYNADNQHGSQRKTSDVFALATAIMFQSPVQHFALAPNNLDDAPSWAIDFMKNVPTTWDDVKFIDGYPGKYCIMARRTGDRWYVVGINAQESPVKLKLSLPMFAAGSQLKVYSDTPSLAGSLKSVTLSKKQQIQISIPCNGGLVITE